MNLNQFKNILLSRKKLSLQVLVVTIVTTLVISLLLPKQYLAETSVMVEQRSNDPVTGMSLPTILMPGYMATQVDVITSHIVTKKVVEKLKLSDDPILQKDFAKANVDGDIKDWIAELLLKKLDVRPTRESNLITIKFTSPNNQFSANVANAFANAYIQSSIELITQPARSRAESFDLQITTLRKDLESAQTAKSDYQQKNGIVVANNGAENPDEIALEVLTRQLAQSQAHTKQIQFKKSLLETTIKNHGAIDSLPDVLGNILIYNLKTELGKVEANLAAVSQEVSLIHPKRLQAQASVDNLQHKIIAEVNIIQNNYTNEIITSRLHEVVLANTVAKQKAKMLELIKQHNDLAVLTREVEGAQKQYDTAMQRSGQSHMESEINQTNIAILNPAFPPQKPDQPKLLLNMFLAVFLGSILALGTALLAELLDRRIRSASDVSDALNLPVFSIIPQWIP